MFKGMDYAYEVYREKSFSRAAEKLFISQPSLSANVKRIEDKVGYPIFNRSTKPLELTSVGREYIDTVEKIKIIEEEFESYVNDMGELKAGRLMFGGSHFFSSWVLPPIISEFSAKFPELELSLTEAKSVDLINALKDSKIHFLLDDKEVDLKVFNRIEVAREQLLLVVPKAYEINDRLSNYRLTLDDVRSGRFKDENVPAVELANFAKYPFILLHPSNDTGKRAAAICQDYKFRADVMLELDQQLTAFNIASTGAGITFSGELLISRVPPAPDLVYYKLDSPHIERSIWLSWKKGRYLSKAMQEFLKYINEKKKGKDNE